MTAVVRALRRFWEANFARPLRAVDDRMRANLAANAALVDGRTAWVLIAATVALTVQEYGDHPSSFARPVAALAHIGMPELAGRLAAWLDSWQATRLATLSWWVLTTVVTYILIPCVVVKCCFREKLADYGCRFSTAFVGWPIYLAMACLMFPIVYLVSFDPAFLRKYPFYPLAPGESVPADFLAWELLYAFQFLGLEFFFRGFILHGLKPRFGAAAIFVMTMPYCMIHFGKPLPETVAAILAGLALGAMSLKTGSIWLGAALHIAVAWTMDFLALWQKGHLSATIGGG
jgi:membrane protease YdiL (CAAX protease family)